jgi:hypothetical protein
MTITADPTYGSIKEAVAALRKLPKPPAPEKREPIEMPERDRN